MFNSKLRQIMFLCLLAVGSSAIVGCASIRAADERIAAGIRQIGRNRETEVQIPPNGENQGTESHAGRASVNDNAKRESDFRHSFARYNWDYEGLTTQEVTGLDQVLDALSSNLDNSKASFLCLAEIYKRRETDRSIGIPETIDLLVEICGFNF